MPPAQTFAIPVAPTAALPLEAPPAEASLFGPPPMGPDDGFSMLDDAPPLMDDDFPDDEEDDDEPPPMTAAAAPAEVPQMAVPLAGLSADDPDLADAKKHAVELLQGRILE
jgi:hypothetical protein